MKSLFTKLLGIPALVWNFYAPLLRHVAATGAAALLPVALDIVRSLADTNKTSSQKRDEAYRKLKSAATKQGVTATESLLRWTIESAVQRLKTENI